MAGTFSEQATLASDNAFINKVKVAMLFRAHQLINSQAAQTFATLNQAIGIIRNAGADATSIAWNVAAGNSTIAAAAPAVPTDSDVQFAVNTILAQIIS